MSAQKVELRFPFGKDIPGVYCPVCGTIAQSDDEAFDMPTCPHVEFRFIGLNNEYDYSTPSIDKLIEEWKGQHGETESIFDSIDYIAKDDNQTRIILEITTGGGPSAHNIAYGFNYFPEDE